MPWCFIAFQKNTLDLDAFDLHTVSVGGPGNVQAKTLATGKCWELKLLKIFPGYKNKEHEVTDNLQFMMLVGLK